MAFCDFMLPGGGMEIRVESAVLQTMMGTLGSLGFAVLFGITEKRVLAWIAAGSAVGWGIYLGAVSCGSGIYIGLLICSLFISEYSERMARILRVPAISIMVPAVIPEIPGGDLYYAMSELVQGNLAAFREKAQQVVLEASAIAMGIVLAAFAEIIIRRIIAGKER